MRQIDTPSQIFVWRHLREIGGQHSFQRLDDGTRPIQILICGERDSGPTVGFPMTPQLLRDRRGTAHQLGVIAVVEQVVQHDSQLLQQFRSLNVDR